MSLLLDALQRASKEKEKLAESRGAPTLSSDENSSAEPAAERSPFPALSIETAEEVRDTAPSVELTMEPIVSTVAASTEPKRGHDPVPMQEMSSANTGVRIAPDAVDEEPFTLAGSSGGGGPSPVSPAVDEIAAALAAPMTISAGKGGSSSTNQKITETKATAENPSKDEPTVGRGDSSGTSRTTGAVSHPSPALSPQVAREILGATAKRPTNRRLIALGSVAVLFAGLYLAFFLGAFDRFLGKSGSSLTPAIPPPAVAAATAPTPTPPATNPEPTPPEKESGKANDAALTAQIHGGARDIGSLPMSKAARRKPALATDQVDGIEGGMLPAARSQGSRQSSPVIVTRAATPNSLDAAYAAMTEGRLDEAATTYRTALASNPGERDAFLGLAYIAQRKGNIDEARALYLQVLRIDPANSAANSGLLAIAAEGDLPQAASRAREMAERAPNSAVVMGTLGGILAKEGRIAEAQQAYFRALTLEPENAFHAFNLAVALDKLHKNSQALSFYQRALALAEKSAEADRSGFPFKEARQRVEQLRQQPAIEPPAPVRSDSQAR